MGWDKGKYYTRSVRRNGRVEREYVGCGELAHVIAQVDAWERTERKMRRLTEEIERDEIDALDRLIRIMFDATESLVRSELELAGYHQHDRGSWRKKRVENKGNE